MKNKSFLSFGAGAFFICLLSIQSRASSDCHPEMRKILQDLTVDATIVERMAISQDKYSLQRRERASKGAIEPQFLSQYESFRGIGDDLLKSRKTTFDSVVFGDKHTFKAFLGKSKVQGFETKTKDGKSLFVELDEKCGIKRTVFIEYSDKTETSGGFNYYTKDFCKDLPVLDSIYTDLKSADFKKFTLARGAELARPYDKDMFQLAKKNCQSLGLIFSDAQGELSSPSKATSSGGHR